MRDKEDRTGRRRGMAKERQADISGRQERNEG